ncbi:hypothetical protein EXN66_Car000001 [Channa argus]|uniref:Uncharacterized protein n=1 Tax=Channa argus TaxID=215402 RepID=A0A6G1QVV7_CHAAH|nr:hypothetical protein EXN66_Car000001 [Channa argus]
MWMVPRITYWRPLQHRDPEFEWTTLLSENPQGKVKNLIQPNGQNELCCSYFY